ncbi:MAG: amino acid permease [Candidatus Pacebacteria bacterium]|nr:amino acid permease [Candidatus Paceibacterota bacterium]
MAIKTNKTKAVGSTAEDEKQLKAMGYNQELSRRMGGFSNFAISFAIICILAGGITAFPIAIATTGGFSIGVGWPVGALFAIVVAVSMAQIASAYPTAGGLYHWASILGGKGYGWVTAWINLLGLVFVVASIVAGLYDPFFKTLIAPLIGIDPASLTAGHQIFFMGAMIALWAWLNHRGINIVSKLTDWSGYLIMLTALLLVIGVLAYAATSLDFGKLFTYTNFTGTEGNPYWPTVIQSGFLAFLPGLILATYTITGYDASAHVSEETFMASSNVPKGLIHAVVWSSIFGYIMVIAFVLAIPDMAEAVKSGGGFLQAIMAPIPPVLRAIIGIGIFVVNFLCGLAALTSTSRMAFAFARDGGLPFSKQVRKVHVHHKVPGVAIWSTAILAFAVTLYSDAFLILASGSAVFLYISYIMPVAAGLFVEGKSWKTKGPLDLGWASKPIAVLAIIGGFVLAFVGMWPPNDKVFYALLLLLLLLAIFWWVFGVRNNFRGVPKAK